MWRRHPSRGYRRLDRVLDHGVDRSHNARYVLDVRQRIDHFDRQHEQQRRQLGQRFRQRKLDRQQQRLGQQRRQLLDGNRRDRDAVGHRDRLRHP